MSVRVGVRYRSDGARLGAQARVGEFEYFQYCHSQDCSINAAKSG